MEKTEFAKLLRTEVEVKSGREVKLVKVKKNNGVELMGFSIIHPGKKIAATTYVENYWDSFEAGEMSLEDIAKQVVVDCENGMMDVKDNVLDFFLNYEEVKSRLGCRLINYDRNKDMLQNSPHRRVMDLAVVYQCSLNIAPGSIGSLVITKEHLERWGVSEKQFIADAEENIQKNEDPVIVRMDEMAPSVFDMLREELDDQVVDMYVMTTKSQQYGAKEMIYGTSKLKEFAEEMNSDLYILPCSVHEVILVPGEYDEELAHGYANIVREVNMTVLEPELILSDYIFFFDRKEGNVRLAG